MPGILSVKGKVTVDNKEASKFYRLVLIYFAAYNWTALVCLLGRNVDQNFPGFSDIYADSLESTQDKKLLSLH